ncbi:iron complex transport system substrate-binding protein [Kribbella aluminosa]|uniref:Iron complex transport system substrate-binding protein n=1 Tax=Kribbella aluminosa TaxID=416017 RepID=A0ABS4ULL3_9ACTN|nr:ABC transporter substrate-binding protein [Kribbella aluminosa]MBP2352531.1 iron complex transport system substrate-binding protein [Kribbella aluminosa]
MAVDGWSFDDDRQQHVTAAARPTRILAYAQAAQTLAALGVPVVGYFGSQHHADTGSAPVAGVDAPYVGSGDTVDTDLIAELRPDLIVSVTYGGEVYGVSADVIADVAPVVLIGIAGDRTLPSVIDRFHELATALGADVADPADALAAALEKLPTDKQVVALSGGTPTDAYVANPAYWPSLRLLRDAGVPFTSTTTAGGWEVVKWTDLPRDHAADFLLYDQRPNSLSAEKLAEIPAWSEVTGQVLPWNPEPPLTYEAAAASVTALATPGN